MDHTPSKTSKAEGVRFDLAEDVLSSLPSSPRRSTRIKKPPPITPRRFNRFFTPRFKHKPQAVKTSRKALKDLSATALNSRQQPLDSERPFKRRRLSFQSPSSSLPSSPLKHVGFLSSSQDHPDDDDLAAEVQEDDTDSEATTDVEDELPLPRLSRYTSLGLSSRLAHMRLSGSRKPRTLCGDRLHQEETANFYSSPQDFNNDTGPTPQQTVSTLPFCITSCNTNPLIAAGDEEGRVRLIETANDCSNEFKRCHLILKPHDNAIMDMSFSEDDYLLATASGDQTCQIIDVQAQRSLHALNGHLSSIKAIKFQPGTKHMFVTCSRDGTVAIWDTRVKSSEQPLMPFGASLTNDMVGRDPIRSIQDAHLTRTHARSSSSRTEPSITSLAFPSPSQPHLFATASSNDSVVKLWDMRAKHKYRSKVVPVSSTAEPKSHELHRRFGIASMAMSTDNSKFYTLCRDHTVYAYSTSHLILGSAPELPASSPAFDAKKGSHTGLGPLYGFRHPSLQINTFYNKLSIRKASETTTEMIAVGSSDDCAVLFPTADRYLTKANRVIPIRPATTRPRLMRIDSQSTSLAFLRRREQDNIPIYYHGTPLIKGHDKEVTGVAWSSEGNLVTISDDLGTRCWREDGEKARGLRKNDGEIDRVGSGWASVSEGFDEWDY